MRTFFTEIKPGSAAYPELTPTYLFLGVRFPFQGRRPRSCDSNSIVLGRFDNIHGLTDSAGRPLRFSQTHRLRHTRTTELHRGRGAGDCPNNGGSDLGLTRLA